MFLIGCVRTSYDPVFESWASVPFRVCQLLCPPYKHLGTFGHSQPHATITTKLFCFSGSIENKRVVLIGMPALGAGGPEFESRRPDQNISRVFFSLIESLLIQDSPVEFRQTGGLDSQVVL